MKYRLMNDVLTEHLLSVAQAYMEATGCSLAAAGKKAKNGDTVFFVKLVEGTDSQGRKVSFTARSYDEILQWFSDNWPEHAIWPELGPIHMVRPPASQD